jgi:hypothetical protein
VLNGIVRGPARDDRDLVMLGQVLAKLGKDLAGGGPVRVEVLVQDEDPHGAKVVWSSARQHAI